MRWGNAVEMVGLVLGLLAVGIVLFAIGWLAVDLVHWVVALMQRRS